MTKENLLQHLQECCDRLFGCSLEMATEKQVYRAVCVAVRELLEDDRRAFVEQTRAEQRKQVYYMSMEFLVGTSLRNNLYNMGLLEPAGEILHDLGFSLESLCALEPDAGLGNGGLGRLASCYMDAATGLNYPVTGFSIRYEFGIFRQKIVDGWQMEFPDNWLEMGDVWLHTRKDDAVEVRFGGQVHEWMDGDKFKTAQTGYQSVIAVPHDLYISGYGSKAVNKLTLWSASMPQSFDMNAFSRGDYVRALEQNTMAEAISKVLYPADDHINGKRLRLRQQYLLVSSSLQSILNEHLKNYHTLDNLADKVAVHINDTHPALCVPELMRLLVDEHDYGWERAWEITCATLSYTNHTVMAEALERWPVDLFREQLPRIYAICQEINRRLMEKLHCVYPNDPGKWEYMAAVTNSEVRMANLCLACCHKINGVSQLHTEILEKTIFRDYYNLDHSRFLNITNGIAYRRWLCQSNPALTGYLQSLIGDGFLNDANALEALLQYRDDPDVLENLQAIVEFLNGLDVTDTGAHIREGIAQGMTEAGFDSDAETVASNLEKALNTALQIESPSKRVKPTGEYVAAGIGEGMSGYDFFSDAQSVSSAIESALQAALTGESLKGAGNTTMQGLGSAMSAYPMSDTGRAVATNVRSAVHASLNENTLRSAGVNAMAGLRAGILAGRSGVISAMRSAAREAVNAAKKELKIKSPSQVFRDEVGVMTMRGFGAGVLKESKEQAKVIRNASRFLTGEAQTGAIVQSSSDNRRTYNNNVSSTIQVQQMVVRDEQDVRSLAVEIATLTRRQQRGKGLRMA